MQSSTKPNKPDSVLTVKRGRGAPKGNKNALGNKGGPSKKWQSIFVEQVKRYCLLNHDATNEEIAKFFDVTPNTIIVWKREKPEFAQAMREGKSLADGNVANALYQRAIGYEHDAVKIFADPKTGDKLVVPYVEHYPPDTGAAKLWLTNRSRHWKDKQTVEVEDPQGILAEMLGLEKEDLPK